MEYNFLYDPNGFPVIEMPRIHTAFQLDDVPNEDVYLIGFLITKQSGLLFTSVPLIIYTTGDVWADNETIRFFHRSISKNEYTKRALNSLHSGTTMKEWAEVTDDLWSIDGYHDIAIKDIVSIKNITGNLNFWPLGTKTEELIAIRYTIEEFPDTIFEARFRLHKDVFNKMLERFKDIGPFKAYLLDQLL